MSGNLLQLLEENKNTFSKGQKLLAVYIADSYDQAAFMTAAKLGETVGVSESTVVRFASELGFDGYPGLQVAMRMLVQGKMSANNEIVAKKDEDLISELFRSEMDNLHQTALFLDREEFKKAMEALTKCDHIYVIGCNNNRLLAEYLGSQLQFFFDKVHIITDSGADETFQKLLWVGGKDAVISMNFPKYSDITEKATQYCRSTGAVTIGFTDNKSASFAKKCDFAFFARGEQNGVSSSLTVPFCLINAVIQALAVGRENLLSDKVSALNNIFDLYDV